ncbi:MAG: glycosyl hydrolase family 28-related protein [Verrucomicrobiota bacterium]
MKAFWLIALVFALGLGATPGLAELRHRFEESKQSTPLYPFVYDPVSGESAPNSGILDGAAIEIETGLDWGNSFTIEAFAKPTTPATLKGREWMAMFQTATTDLVLYGGIRRSPAPHSYHWWLGRLNGVGPPLEWSMNRYNGFTMVKDECPWRHFAMQWDAEAELLTTFLDYRKLKSAPIPDGRRPDLSKLWVGGDEEHRFQGAIDEFRISKKLLRPWEFLRLSKVPLSDISFAPESSPALHPDYGHVDVRLHYGAVGNGVIDDTEAIQRAFSENDNRIPIEYPTVYFPEGEYLISDMIRFRRFMVARGAGPDKTLIRLKDSSPEYSDKAKPRAAFAVGYDWPYVGRTNKQRAGNVIGNYVMDLAIDTGSGNPAALGLDFHCNNVGSVSNVSIRSGDGEGLVGLDLRRPWPGPCLIRDVTIEGFDKGIAASSREYSLVFSDVTLTGQKECVIENLGNALALERITSDNSVPAVINRNGGLVVMMRSQLRGGDNETIAIQSENSSLYLRDVEVEGYGGALLETSQKKDEEVEILTQLEAGLIAEYVNGKPIRVFPNDATGSLKLPIADAPEIQFPPGREWVDVSDYEELVIDGDWSVAIEAAMESGGELLFFPRGPKYRIDRDVEIKGEVRTFLGGSPELKIGNGVAEAQVKQGRADEGPAFVVREGSALQFQFLEVAHVRHEGPRTLLFRHGKALSVSADESCGDLFIEDAGGMFRFGEHQRVWGRQLNPETKEIPEIINRGGQLWVLGLKTEYLSTKIVNIDGARTEILGGLMYPVHPVKDETLPMFSNTDSSISLIHAISAYQKNHRVYMRDTQAGETREYRDWHWLGGRMMMPLYRSEP